MSKQREALEMALQALEEIATNYPADWELDICVYAKNLLREALAEPARKPLTDEEIMKTAKETQSAEPGRDGYILPFAFARAIERAHGITE